MISVVVQPIARVLAALGIVVAFVCSAFAGEEATIKAFAAWQGSGQLFVTGPRELTFAGALSGTVYVETEKGPLESGRLVCPAMVRINLEDGAQSGSGRCAITAKDGAQIFADVACTGIRLIGCDGQFTLTGGTKRFEGITGGGPLTMRNDFAEIASISATAVRQDAAGIMYWPALHYSIP